MKAKNTIREYVFIIVTFLLSAGIALGQSPKTKANQLDSLGQELDTYFKTVMNSQKYVALGACLIKNDQIVWDGYYGYADREEQKPLQRESIFLLASLSKTVTTTALMLLYDRGLFQLDDDLNRYLPFKVRNPNFPNKPITFRMLLTHTAGFADVLPMGNKISLGVTGDSEIPLAEFVEELFTPGGKYYSTDYFSINEPGTKYEYSNISFALVGYLVERFTGQDFSEFCKTNIFKPLEMNNTGWHLRDLDTSKIVYGYGYLPQDNITTYKKTRHFGMPGYPEGMLRTTIPDFTKFISIFINNGQYKRRQILKPSTVELMLTPQNIKNIPSRSFPINDIGLTWLINDINGEKYYNMNGFAVSIFANAYFSTKDKTGVIFYFTGITMQNMPAMLDISRKLIDSVKKIP